MGYVEDERLLTLGVFIDADGWWKDPKPEATKSNDKAEKTLYDGFQGTCHHNPPPRFLDFLCRISQPYSY